MRHAEAPRSRRRRATPGSRSRRATEARAAWPPSSCTGADVVLTDLAMPEMDGMQVLERMRANDPSVPVPDPDGARLERVAVAAMKAGAFDYIPKPFDPDELVLAVRRATDFGADLRLQNARLRTEAALGRTIIAHEPQAMTLRDGSRSRGSRPKDVTVLLTGEKRRRRKGRPCHGAPGPLRAARTSPSYGSTPPRSPASIAEAELFFGHTRGAFTGAQTARLGYFQQAQQGNALHRRDRRAAGRDPGQRCCGRCNRAKCSSWAAGAPRPSTCGSSARPTATSRPT